MGLIDKNVLQEALREEYDRNKALYDKFGYIERGGIVQGLSYAEMILCKQTTIEAEPVRGRWIKPTRVSDSMLDECSVCGFDTGAYTFNFCPNCGAKMESEEKPNA